VTFRDVQNCLRCMGYDLDDYEAQNFYNAVNSQRNGCIPYHVFLNQVQFYTKTKQKLRPIDKKVVVKPNGQKKVVLNYGSYKVVKIIDAQGRVVTKKFGKF